MARRVLFLILISVVCISIVQLAAGFREKNAETRYPATGDLIDVDGTKIHVEVFGETGPDLVLLHGASGNLREFTHSFVQKLQDRYRVIVMDRPGLGWSQRPKGYGGAWNSAGESPRLQARILKQALDQVGADTPLVVGHSFGGAVAMAWALEHSDTAGVVMLGAVSHPWPGDLNWQYPVNASPAGGALFVPLLTAFAPNSYVNSVVASIFEPQAAPEGYIGHVGVGLTLRRKAMRANARQVNGLRPHIVDMAEFYPGLDLPVEIVHGDLDTIVPLEVHSRPLSERMDSAALTILEGVGHMPHHADPQAVIDAIDRAASRAGLR